MPSTQKNFKFSQLRVGIFVLVALGVLGFLIINSSGELNPFHRRMKIKARFPTADGLRQGSAVQLAGVPIGTVDEVRFLPPDSPEDEKIEVLMSIDQILDGRPITDRIRTDSTARLVATSLLANDKLINITTGTSKGAAVSENYILPSSQAISINQLTQTGDDLLQQINKLAVPANEILQKANNGEGTLGRIVNDESLYNNLDSAVGETKLTVVKLQSTLDKINRGDGTAGKLLNDPELYNSLNGTVAKRDRIATDLRAGRGTAGKFLTDEQLYNDARAAVSDLRDAVRSIKPTLDQFNQIATDLNEGKGTAGKLLKDDQLYNDARDTLVKFNSTASKLDVLLGDAQSGKGTVGKLLTDESLYNNLNQTTANINQITTEGTKLIYDFRQNPKKYLTIKFSIF